MDATSMIEVVGCKGLMLHDVDATVPHERARKRLRTSCYCQFSQKEISNVLAGVIEKQMKTDCQRLEDLGMPQSQYIDIFCGTSPPSLSLRDYIERIIRYLSLIVEHEVESGHDKNIQFDLPFRYLIVVLMFLEKLTQSSCMFLCPRNIHRLIITGVTVASKILDDSQPSNSYFAKLGGISLKELNYFETIFCMSLKFRLSIPVERFEVSYTRIVQELVLSSSCCFLRNEPGRKEEEDTTPVAAAA